MEKKNKKKEIMCIELKFKILNKTIYHGLRRCRSNDAYLIFRIGNECLEIITVTNKPRQKLGEISNLQS